MMLEQFYGLKNLYGEYINLNVQISKLIDSEDYEGLHDTLNHKDKILNHIINQEKIVQPTEEQKIECKKLKDEIVSLEKENIEKLSKAKDEVHKELTRVNKNANLHKAYKLYPDTTGDIVDSLE